MSTEMQNSGQHVFDLLIAADEIPERKIYDFRMKLPSGGREVFDMADEIRQRLLVVIDSLTPEEIAIMRGRLGDYSLVAHNFNNLLTVYYSCFQE